MAKLIKILSNVYSEPQAIIYRMMFQQTENEMKKPRCSENDEKQTTDIATCFEKSSSNESTKVLFVIPSVHTKSVQSGNGLKKYRNVNNQCGVPYKKLKNKCVHFVHSPHKLDCKVGPSSVNLKNDAQTNSTEYKICEAHRKVFQILTNWPRRSENSRLRKEHSTSYYDYVKTHITSIGKALIMKKIKLPTYYPPEQQIMKLYKSVNLENATTNKAKMTMNKENKKRNKDKRVIRTKAKCTRTQTDEFICRAVHGDTNKT